MTQFADDNFRYFESGEKFSKKRRKHWEKGEIARYEQFLLFPQYFFRKRLVLQTRKKQGLVWETVTPLLMYVPSFRKKGFNAFHQASCYPIMDL